MDESSLDKRTQQPVNLTKQAAPDAARPDLRASDADRDRVAEILREALAQGRLDAEEHADRIDAVYRAKTVGELEPLVCDLPAADAAHHPGPDPATLGRDLPAAPTQNLVAVFSAASRKGRWQVPAKINATAVFGSVEIDLTEAVFTQREIVINCTSVMGSVEIRVPENVRLRSNGSGVLGAFEVDVNDVVEGEAPIVVVNGFAVLGSVEAKPRRGKWVKDLHQHVRRHQERMERRLEEHMERRTEWHDRHAQRHERHARRRAERREGRRGARDW